MIEFDDCGNTFNRDYIKSKWIECSGFDDEGNPTFFVVEPFDVDPLNLDKRVRAMIDIIDHPTKKTNMRYNINQAINLGNICKKANRQDLADKIEKAL